MCAVADPMEDPVHRQLLRDKPVEVQEREPRLRKARSHCQGCGISSRVVVRGGSHIAERLEEAGGVDFESKPYAMGSGPRIFFVKDPDGYRIESIE